MVKYSPHSADIYTSDTHFNHANIISSCHRPFNSLEHMNETLIANWNNVVQRNDIVFHLGDFSFGGAAQWAKIRSRLNGRIYLIVGNHDKKNLRQSYCRLFEMVSN